MAHKQTNPHTHIQKHGLRTPSWLSFCHTYNKGVPFLAQKLFTSIFGQFVVGVCCVLPARLRVAQMGVELRLVAMLTRFPPNWTTVQSQVACDMCSEAYPPRVTHIQMLQGVLLAACNVQLWSKLKPSECSRLSGKQLLKNV